MKPVALSIAGSDSGGGAGIQADLKAMEANGVFGTSALTAVTAQNTHAVEMAFDLPLRIIRAQIDAVASDFPVAAAKTGMLSSAAIIETVSDCIATHELTPLVVDPVMISKSGYKLLADDAIDTLIERLIPLATVITPNLHEARHLLQMDVQTLDDARAAAKALHELGAKAVLVKGGHLSDSDEAVDVLYDGRSLHTFSAPRIDTPHTHGTGCTYASAIAAQLAHGRSLTDAVERAKQYVTRAIEQALPLGSGHGPTNHFPTLDTPATTPSAAS
ncbi:bifunctional hydroxymethylpyrimidine kinase/phosphomethylpyrimidine kinase [Salisaeta longa]|uniref:bifunctional hydroxymethylpyrimidine kinase/phosphomethylpyrimidine kinase n=1 Tax=Salisaeta longa TaxID=503170 RepID=UPI0003B4A29F|nr:bifunctional hydroxymethylpyrimidine kinase/phosphomethylpyrimidine kinase [Salisaeta longa]